MGDATPPEPPQGSEAEEQAPAADAGKPAKAAKAAKARKADKPAAKAKHVKDGESKAEPKAKAPKAKAKAVAKKAPAKNAAEDEPAQGKPRATGRSATKKRGEKKAAVAKAAAPGDAAEAQELAKARDAEKPGKLGRRAVASAKGAPRRRVVRAHARYVRTSARKARMVCGHIRGKSVQEARAILAFTSREVARDWSKLLESAVANAESNHELLEDDLIVREAYADEGPTIKRFRPRAMGRATPIRKRTSHLTITLSPRPEPGNTKRHG